MRFLLAALGSHGDVLPTLAVAQGLAQRGHSVCLSAPEPFRSLSERAGIAFDAMCTQEEYDAALAHRDLWNPRLGGAAVGALALSVAERTLHWIENEALRGPCTLAATPLAFGARLAQEMLRWPLVTLHVAPFLIESRLEAPWLPGVPCQGLMTSRMRHRLGRGADRFLIDPAILPGLNRLRAELGLKPVKRLRHWWNSPRRMLLMFPPWYALPQRDWPKQAVQVGFPIVDRLGDESDLDAALHAFLEAGAPPLVFTYGSGMRQAARFFEVAAAICARLGRRGILISREPRQVPAELGPSVISIRYAPLSQLLPRSAALIHHGGIGTIAQALAAGVPQLVVPVAFNHFDDSRRLARLGVGHAMHRRLFTPARAARALSRILRDPAMTAACDEIRQAMHRDFGIGPACDVVEQAASSH